MVSPTSTQHSKQRADVLPAAPRTGPTGVKASSGPAGGVCCGPPVGKPAVADWCVVQNWSTNEETNSPKPLKVGWSGDDDIHE